MTPHLAAQDAPPQVVGRSFTTALFGFLGSTVATTVVLFLINQV